MHPLIASNQSAFIKGRNLVDGVLVVNEVVDLAKRIGKECLIFKVDFEKAYDSVDWGFLEYMLRSPTGEVNIQRGLKQGVPLAPLLFLLVAEGFGGAMRRAGDLNLFKGYTIGRGGPIISHLQYADDTLCIGEASVDNLWTLKAILRGFELASGLKRQDSFKYLDLPVGENPRRVSTWDPLVEMIRRRLNSWGNKHISLGGRWRLLQRNDTALWKEVLMAKYGTHILQDVSWPNGTSPSFASLWWKDIRDLEVCVESKNWLADTIVRRLGNGLSTRLSALEMCWRLGRVRDVVGSCFGDDLFSNGRKKVLFICSTLLKTCLFPMRMTSGVGKYPEGSFTVKTAYEALLREIVSGTLL
ncbi:ribonuclease H, partial [Trifolium pratense]